MTPKNRGAEHYFSVHPESKEKLGLIHTNLRGKPFTFLTSSSIFSKKRVDTGTRLLIETMTLPETGYILDVGCGYGAVGITAATINPNLHIIMIDVNTRAVHLTKQNIQKNKATNAEARNGYLYEPVKELTFNCVLSNPPVSAGMETVKAIITQAPKIMAAKATLQMVIKSKTGGKTLQSVFNEAFGNSEVLARESGYRVLIAEKH